jgi:hypothetical protein
VTLRGRAPSRRTISTKASPPESKSARFESTTISIGLSLAWTSVAVPVMATIAAAITANTLRTAVRLVCIIDFSS